MAESIWDMVIEDMRGRDKLGRKRYGTPLTALGNRNALQDAYEEVLDLAVYLKQHLIRLEDMRRLLRAADRTVEAASWCRDEFPGAGAVLCLRDAVEACKQVMPPEQNPCKGTDDE